MTPERLGVGAHLRVIAPSRSGLVLSEDTISRAVKRLQEQGFRISFGAHWKESSTVLNNASNAQRLDDLHDAFKDPDVDGIITAIGGFNANQLLSGIDYDLIRENPKVFCGFSDITVLANALFAKSGLITYLGPHFSSWAMEKGFRYSRDYFLKAVQTSGPYDITPSSRWSNDEWYINQKNRKFHNNDDSEVIIHEGTARGIVIGGNINGFCKLLGTNYKPAMQNSILLLEQGDETDLYHFDAQLEAITQQEDFSGVGGIIIGRFHQNHVVTPDKLREIIDNKAILKNIPIVANVNLGHTTPIATFAIGGICDIYISTSVVIRMISH